MLSDRETRLLMLLANRTEPISARSLATELNVSVRTVKSYVAKVNQRYEGCIQSDRSGYACNREIVARILNGKSTNPVPQTSSERRSHIIQRLLSSKGALNIYDLGEELFVSSSTIKAEIPRIKSTVQRFSLFLSVKGDRLSLEGTEKDKRKLVSSLLYEEASVRFINLDTISQAFPNIDISFIEECVRTTLSNHHRSANDFSIVDVVLHIVITVDRIQAGHAITDKSGHANHDDSVIKDAKGPDPSDTGLMVETIANQLEKHFGIIYPTAEHRALELLLISRIAPIDHRTMASKPLGGFVDEECISLVNEIISDLRANFGFDLSGQELFARFALHIKNLLLRAEQGGLSKNPLTQQIRHSCPLLYDAAVAVSEILQSRAGISIDDDEIAFIAFHLGSTLEAQRQLTSKISAVLYCPSYYSISDRLALFLECHFDEDLLIVEIVSEEAELEHAIDIDLIITCVPLNSFHRFPVFTINLFPGEKDVAALREVLEKMKSKRRRSALQKNIKNLIEPQLFYINESQISRDEVIDAMSTALIDLGYAPKELREQTLTREHLSPTAYGTCALPHPVRACAYRSSISVMLSGTPIDWGGTSVRLVLLLSFCRDDQDTFYEVFEPLVSILANRAQVDLLIRTSGYQEFVDELCKLIS